MDISSVFTLCGGLAFFLYGMSVMSSGLEKAAGGRLEQMLKKMTANPFKSLLLAFITFLLTNLRLVQGFSQAEFIGRFGEEEWGKLKRKAQKDIDLGLLTILEGRVSCTPRLVRINSLQWSSCSRQFMVRVTFG